MTKQSTYEIIRSTVETIVPGARILLFGSQAKGTADKHSDYDIVILTKRKMEREKRLDALELVHKKLVKSIHAPVDVLMNSEREAKVNQTLPGHIIQTAFREGVFL
jgi:predicted nucleotidyltransferase